MLSAGKLFALIQASHTITGSTLIPENMKKITWIVASLLLVGTLSLTGCSDKTKDSAKETVEEAKNDMDENVADAKADIKEAGDDFEAKVKEDKDELKRDIDDAI